MQKEAASKLLITEDMSSSRRLFYIISLFLCSAAYPVLVMFIIRLSTDKDYIWIYFHDDLIIYKSAISGIISQLLILISVLIALNPIKHSKWIAVALNVFMAYASLKAAVLRHNTDALVGIAVPICATIVVLIISRFGKKLRRQIRKVIKYNQLMKENDERLHKLAYYDNLTGLPNRKMILDQMEALISKMSSEGREFIYVLIDLDNFKKINDTAGHSVGDHILIEIANRWSVMTEQGDILGRFGGDEFSILIPRNLNMEELEAYLSHMKYVLSKAITVNHKDYWVSASFGVTCYPKDGSDPLELLKNADIALYKAKNSGKNIILNFSMEMQKEITHKIRLEEGLSSSIRNQELFMVFQPLYRCGTKELRGFEALARWRYPELGLVSPAQFIPIAEETGMIIDMGKWVIKTVLLKFMELQKSYDIKTIVSINISVVQMAQPDFVSMMKEMIEETGFDSRYLELEITESVLISCPEQMIEVINQLREMGIRIALDDFGTGYASLSNLQQLPIHILKIDKSFIDKITDKRDKKHIVGNIISLAHHLGIEVVAEGVEKEEQLEYLKSHHCDYIQGYLLSKPIGEEQILPCFLQALPT